MYLFIYLVIEYKIFVLIKLTQNLYNSVCARRHKHINSSASAQLNATQIAVMKGSQKFYFRSINVAFWRFFARSCSIKWVLTQLTLPRRSCVGQPKVAPPSMYNGRNCIKVWSVGSGEPLGPTIVRGTSAINSSRSLMIH